MYYLIIPYIQRMFNETAVEGSTWMSNYIWLFCVNFITYLSTNRDAGSIKTYWGRLVHICVSDLTIIGSDNGLSPGRRHVINRTNTIILLIEPFGIHFSDIKIYENAFENVICKMASLWSWPQHYMLASINENVSTVAIPGIVERD